MLKIQLIGYVGKDAEVITSNGKQFSRFSVAVDEIGRNNEKKTRWLTCYVNQDKMSQWLKKGKQVYIEGFHKIIINTGQDNRSYVTEAVNVTNIQLLGKRDDDDLPNG